MGWGRILSAFMGWGRKRAMSVLCPIRRILLAMILCPLIVLEMFPLTAAVQTKPAGTPEKGAQQNRPRPSGNETTVFNQYESPEVKSAADHSQEDIETQRKLVKFTWYLVFVGSLQVVALLVQAFVFWRTLKKIEIQANIMQDHAVHLQNLATAARDNAIAAKKGAEASNENVEMFINKERARLRVELKPLSLSPKPHPIYVVDFTVAIDGPTSAYIVETGCAGYFLPLALIGSEEAGSAIMFSLHLLPKVISPNTVPIEQFTIFYFDSEGDSKKIISEIRGDRLFVEVRGYVKYKDVFDRDHEVRFRYVWKFWAWPSLPDNAERSGQWEKSGSSEDNKET